MSKTKIKQTSVLMLLGHDFLSPKIDPRVYKEAISLQSAEFKVTIIHLSKKQGRLTEFHQIKLLAVKDQNDLAGFKNKKNRFAIFRIIWGMFGNLINTIKTVRKFNFEIIHCHDADMLMMGLLIKIIKLGRVKLIYDSHEIATEMIDFKSFRPLIFWTEKIASFWVDGFITINEQAETFLLKRYHRFKKNPLIIKNVPFNLYSSSQSTVHRPLRFIYQGTLKKSRVEIVEAIVSELNQYDPKLWRLDILGNINELKPGSILLNNPQVAIRKMILNQRKFFQDLAKFDLGIVAMNRSCLNHYFSLPNKLFDYMSSGVAVIAPDFPVIGKILKETQTGYLLDEFSSRQSIKKIIKEIIKNPKNILPKKKKGAYWIKKKYNWDLEEKKLIKFYKKLLG